MALTLRPPVDPPRPARLPARRTPPPARPPFRDNPRLILLGILLLLAALAATLAFANRSAQLSPDFLAEPVLYALSVAVLMMLVALLFVLARYIVKLFVERRRSLPFARFRAKLVMVLLGMTLIPSVLVLLVGSELIRSSVDRWFNAPMEQVLTSARDIAADYYQERRRVVTERADQVARTVASVDLAQADVGAVRDLVASEVSRSHAVDMVEIYRVVRAAGGRVSVVPLVEVAAPTLPRGYNRASADRVAERAAAGMGAPEERPEPLEGGGELIRACAVVRDKKGQAAGVAVVSAYLSGDLAARARQMTDAAARYDQMRVLRRPLTGVYLSYFLMMTLMILVGATWIGVYMAKRITRPIRALSSAAREIGAGHLDHRVEAETADEFGSLVEAFNTMAAELAASRRRLERSTVDLQRKNVEVEERRRYIETILERIATGVVSVDGAGRLSTLNTAASRLIGVDAPSIGRPASEVFAGDLAPLGDLLERARQEGGETQAQEVALVRQGRDLHLAAVATTLHGEPGAPEARVLVFDDVTPLIRAQKVAAWREVARRLAHEVKNPLTPIQLSAERLQRHFANAPAPLRDLVDECTTSIVAEVESLKSLVDEFSQFARMPPPKRVPTDLAGLVRSSLGLYNGLFRDVQFECRFAEDVPTVNVDPEQIRRVVINLVDNAIEAMDRQGTVTIEVGYAPADHLARMVIADDGPGIPASERDKLFLPYYSTKRRGSGLGLAIVRRIVIEHGGAIDVGDNTPKGTRFAIELPC